MGRIGAGVLMIGALLFLFQNCGKAGFENQEMIEEMSAAENVDPKIAQMPFPYQVSVNQIAHMTCPLNVQPETMSPYFSWKLGAFDNPADVPTASMKIRPAGVQLNPQFLSAWEKMSVNYNPDIVKERLKETIMAHPMAPNAQVQVSFRKTNLPKTDLMPMPSGGMSPVFPFMESIESGSIADAIKQDPRQVYNFFPAALNFTQRSMEAQMIVPSSYGFNDQALRANYDASFLTLGFGKSDDPTKLIGPSDDPRLAYGKGYRVHFGVGNPHQGTSQYPTSDSLAFVEEYDLETGYRTTGVGWDCSYRFKIVRPQDRYNPMYRANHFNRMPSGECPVKARGEYCASPINPQFGISLAKFAGQCPSNRQFLSGEYCEEHYAAACPDEPHTRYLSHPNAIQREDGVYHESYPDRPALLHALRRFLPVSQWDINVGRRCIVPKMDDNACYGSAPVVYDEYFFSGTNANPNLGMHAGCGVAGQHQCAAYLTLCVRR